MKTKYKKLTNPEIIIQEGDEVLYIGSAITRRVRDWKPVEENIIGATTGAYTSHIFRRPVPVQPEYEYEILTDPNKIIRKGELRLNFRGLIPDHQEIDRQMAWAHEINPIYEELIEDYKQFAISAERKRLGKKVKENRNAIKRNKLLTQMQDTYQFIENNLLREFKIPTHFTGLCNMDHCSGIKLNEGVIPKGTTHVAEDRRGDKIYVSVDGGSFLHWLENKQIWAQPYGEFPYALNEVSEFCQACSYHTKPHHNFCKSCGTNLNRKSEKKS